MTPTPAARLVRIEELAAESGVAVRNIRVYREKGLLPPPLRRGRAALYGDEHRRRLRLVLRLLDRGYTFATINELFVAERHGLSLPELLEGESAAIRRPPGSRRRYSREDAEEFAGFEMPEELIEQGGEIGLTSEPGSGNDFFADAHMYALFRELIRLGVDQEGIDRIGHRILDGQRTAAEAFDVLVETMRAEGLPQKAIEERVRSLLTRAGGAVRLIFLSAATTLLVERHGFPEH